MHQFFNPLTEVEKAVLRRQFDASPFAQDKSNRKPTKLAIFDFDSTLFLSPQLSHTIWHDLLINAVIAENMLGPGWWRDVRSLQLGEKMQGIAWEGYWNEDVVEEAREAIEDPDTMAILLTGRRYHPFHQVIPSMLEAKSLDFDLIGLRPDPEREHACKWTGHDDLVYNPPSVFSSTMQFKQRFITHLLQRVPSLRQIRMWDDRKRHVHTFLVFLEALEQRGVLDQGHVKHVLAVLPRYNPQWERDVVERILSSHNKVLEERQLQPYTIVPVPTSTVVVLDKRQAAQLSTIFEAHHREQCSKPRPGVWAGVGVERPEFFGDHVLVSSSPSHHAMPLTKIGERYDIRVIAFSSAAGDSLVLQVQLRNKKDEDWCDETYLLPLWYKPSMSRALTTLTYHWQRLPAQDQIILHGKLEHTYRLGLELLSKPGKRKLEDSYKPDKPTKHL
ncbi:hypothetical protein DFQ28_007986 [Apophysomyces sp. BC1034]|nr:hypothetical protein DFQ30_007295 [Apophysomyces sp. BC1015]KAG0182084.1 hypothetical protein DFQ29_005925 [Apophysomyces sp. BC1021]KAG0192742.1 hypothetical protein DFQ28_007986 [Apophysomyces sp. BC1034]